MKLKAFAAYLAVFALAVLVGAMPLALHTHPLPYVPDEFSYLLAADTFAHGRLTNPPLPHSEYFQTSHELTSPTYASKYPPGQGLTLSAGQVFGDPLYGTIGTTAFACVAVLWMARAWLPLQWALLAGVLAALHPLVRFWTQSYWGGQLGTLGGALVLGAVLRAARQPRWTSAIMLAGGVGILINMRPLEGSIFTILCGTFLLIQWWRTRIALRRAVVFLAVAFGALTPLLAWTGYYNWRVTGSPIQTPYLLYARQFQGVPSLFVQKPWPPVADINPRLAWFRDNVDGKEYRDQLTVNGYLQQTWYKFSGLCVEWVGWTRLPLIVPLLWGWRSRRLIWATALTVSPIVLQFAVTPWMRWHYLSPGMSAFFLLLALSARQLSVNRLGRAVVVGVVGFAAVMVGVDIQRQVMGRPNGTARAEIIRSIERVPGKHVVVVTYVPSQQQVFEWVFNDADLNAQRIVFAFDRGPQTLSDLRRLFPDRLFWSLQIENTSYHYQPIFEKP